MANQPGTLEQIAIRLGRALATLADRLSDAEVHETLERLGLVVPPALLAQPAVVSARTALVTSAAGLPATIDQLIAAVDAEDLVGIVQHGSALLNDANALIQAFGTLPAAIDGVRGAFPEVTDAQFTAFAAGLARKLLDLLIADAIDENPGVGASLTLAGILERVKPLEATDLDRLEVERTTIHYERITRLLNAPADHFKEVYEWGSPAFDGTKLLPAMAELLGRLGAPAVFHPPRDPDPAFLEAYVLDITANTTIDPPGLDASVIAPFGGTIDAALPLTAPWSGTFSARGNFATVVTATLRPPLSVSVASPVATFEGSAEIRLRGEGPQPFVILGAAGGNRLEVKTVTFGTGVTFAPAGSEPFVKAKLEGGRLLVDGSSGDGFLSKVLSGVRIDSNFDAGLTWSQSTGARFDGSAALTLMLPVHRDLGPFTVHEIFLIASLAGETIPIELSASLSLRLGPLDGSVKRIGFTTTVAFPGEGGNAGPAQVDFAFKPPTGVGLAVDAHGLKGGGFLDIDRPNGRYFGMLNLQFQDTIDITAIAVIDTKLPSGEGFSLLILISAQFQPIQLGLGFTLIGVGGLLGLNRTVDVEVVRTGLKTGALSSILFPDDPIANATKIMSDIVAIFPVAEGRFVFGPMAKIAYGTPPLITIDLGLLIEVPNPVRVAIVGVLKALLPKEGAELLALRVNFLGVIDFNRGELSFDASIFDSRLLAFDLSGDMAVRVRWLGTRMFLVTVGGFHPAFQPPPANLPSLRRLTLQLLKGDNPRLRLETYFAITSNTYQFGARVELYAEAGGGSFSAYGFIAFDVLFQFSPFYFIADVKAMVALRAGSRTIASINLQLTLEGPTPWKARGSASLKLFWFLTIKVRFSKTFGEERGDLLPDVAVLPQLVAALANPANWQSVLPPQRHILVSLRPAPTDAVLVHPLGGLSIGQKIVPLKVPIAKFGNSKPSDHTEFAITGVNAGGDPIELDDIADVQDQFAPAQFFEKTDAEKLSADSFVQYAAGISVGVSQQLDSSHYLGRDVVFDLKYRDSQRATAVAPFKGEFEMNGLVFSAWARNGAVARSPLSFAATGVSALAPKSIALNQERFAVALIDDLTLAAADAEAGSEIEAAVRLARIVATRPDLAGKLQVVPAHEVNRAVA